MAIPDAIKNNFHTTEREPPGSGARSIITWSSQFG
jgi:hypothetical protein